MASLATTEDVEARLGRDLDPVELDRVEGLLAEASALVRGYTGKRWADEIPDGIAVVTSRMVARVLAASSASEPVAGLESIQHSAGSFAQTHKYSADVSSGGVWLARTDKIALRPYRGGVTNVRMY